MAERAEPVITPALVAGLGVAGFLAALSLGTVAVVAAAADTPGHLGAGDWAALKFTLSQALVSAALSTILAIPVARALARRRFFGRDLLITLLGAPFILPVIVAVLGLLAVYGRGGLISELLVALGYAPLSIYGFRGVVLAHVFFNLPLATRLLLQGWQRVPGEHFLLAAQLGMSTRDINRVIERPILRSVLPGAFATIFLLCVTSFAVALTLGGGPRATTIELAIYQAFRFDFDMGRAALLALMQFAIGAGAAVFAWRLARDGAPGAGLGRVARRWDCAGFAARIIDGAVLAAVSLFLLAPLAMVLLRGVFGLGLLDAGAVTALVRSVIVALMSTALTLGMALVLGTAVARHGAGHMAGWIESAGHLSLAASPMVIGTGLFILLYPLVDPASVALAVTALVNAVMSLPFALRALVPVMRHVQSVEGMLADSLDMGGWARFRLVTWPAIRPAAGFAAGLAAALSMGDLGVVALFADPDAATLPLYLYRLMGSYRMEAAQGAALLLVAVSIMLFRLFDWLGKGA